MTRRPLLAALAAGAVLLAAAPADAGGRKKTVEVGDNFYAPSKLKVKPGTTIVWSWPDSPIDVHDVKLKSGPKGVKHFHSELASSGYRFKRKLTKTGTYRIICTLHEEMKMTIRVRK